MSLILHDEKAFVEANKLIELRSKGYLFKPSPQLYLLISKLETAILNVVNFGAINSETTFNITSAINNISSLPKVGCKIHELAITYNVITFHLTTHMFFITKQINKNEGIEERTKQKRKLAKCLEQKRKLALAYITRY